MKKTLMHHRHHVLALILTISLSTALFASCTSPTGDSVQPSQSDTIATTSISETSETDGSVSDASTDSNDASVESNSENLAGTNGENSAEASDDATPGVNAEASIETDDEENYDTGDASLDNPRNDDGIGAYELLVVSFGTSYNDNRRLSIGGIEAALEAAFPNYSVRRAFTSQIIIDHVKRRDGEVIDNVSKALERAVKNDVKTLVVQPTHLMNGYEYTDLVNELAKYSDAFEHIVVGQPLLTTDDDFAAVAQAIVDGTKEYDDGETAICFMGHGTEAESNSIYQKMQDVLSAIGEKNYFIGTVEASPSLEDLLGLVSDGGYKRVVLEPLMVVAGDHANNDMAGEDDDSWLSAFKAAGYEVVPVLKGLGEMEAIQQLYVKHVQEAIASLEN